MQPEHALSPKPHQASSRAPSPVPSTIYSTGTQENRNGSSPRLPQPRRSSFSTEPSSTTDLYEERPLTTQRSFPHLSKKTRKHQQKPSRRGSDATTTTDGSDAGYSITAADSIALPTPRSLANDKRNHDFHVLFRSVPDGERLIDDYGCALQKEILLQGRVYISENHLCFNANIFGWITNLVIAFADIEEIEKRTTAIFIPNAILITTSSSKHFLASFLSRDQAYDQMVELWKASQLNNSRMQIKHDGDEVTVYSDDDQDDDESDTSSGYSYSEDEQDNERLMKPNMLDKSLLQDRQSSLASLPLPKHLSADEAARRRAVSEAGPRPNIQEYIKNSPNSNNNNTTTTTTTASNTTNNTTTVQSTTTAVNNTESNQKKTTTECGCAGNDQHFPNIVMDNKYDTTIETMYNLLYNSSFMDRFLSEVEKSTEVCIGQWSKNNNDIPLSRESSYIKFLGGTIGPKSTKCYLKEEMIYLDTSNYLSQLTVTQTPDVPAGSCFNVKTKTCISWCGKGQVRVLVTVLVDFIKSSWLKSTIEKATMDGQQNFYKSLDAAVRKYLDQNASTGSNKSVSTKKKGGKRRHHKREKDVPTPVVVPEVPQNHFIIEAGCSVLNWFIENASLPNTSQLTMICMAIMVLTNIYIASKMSGVDKQLALLGHHNPHHNNHHQHQQDQDTTSLWKLLSKLDPDARKEDLKFVHQTRDPLPSSIKYQNHNNNEEENLVSDEHLQFSQMAKQKLDKQMMELEKMIQKAGQSMEQVTQVVQNQRRRILSPELK